MSHANKYKPNDLLKVKEVREICEEEFKFTSRTLFFENFRSHFNFEYYGYKIIRDEMGKKFKKPTTKRITYQNTMQTIQKIKNNPVCVED